MTKRLTTLLAVLVIVVAAVGWGLYRSAPGAAWACESQSALECQHRGVIDAQQFDRDGSWVMAVDVDSTSGLLAVSIVNPRDASGARSWTGAAGLVDSATGVVTSWLANDESVFRTENITFSPDGELVGVYVLRRDRDDVDEVFGQLEIYDVSTASLVQQLLRTEESVGCSRLGFSPDNQLVQCNGALVDLESGELVEQLENENRYAVASYSGSSWGPGDTWAEPEYGSLEVRERALGWEPGDPQELRAIAHDWRNPDFRWTSFDDRGTAVAVVEHGEEQPWHERWRTARRAHAPARLTLFDLDAAEVTASVEIGFAAETGAWDASGERVVLVGDSFDFVVLQVR